MTTALVPIDDSDAALRALRHALLIVQGHALAHATATGERSEIDRIGTALGTVENERSPLQADDRQPRAMPQAASLEAGHLRTRQVLPAGQGPQCNVRDAPHWQQLEPVHLLGCHGHTPANMQTKHREEGVAEDLQNCVRCHRSASSEGEGKGKGERGKGKRERD